MSKIDEKTFIIIHAEKYERLMERLDDYELGEIVKERQSEKAQAIEVNLDNL
ncbi:MAG: hypothetical protein QX203_07975 [Methylococcaceae bacterium]